jgi:hypothetical protein
MRPALLALAAALAVAGPAAAADAKAEESAVIATVQRFFDGMAKPDADAIRAVTLPGAVFGMVRPQDHDSTRVGLIPLDDFLKSLRPGLDEHIWAPRVSLRRDLLATVSAPYEIKVDGKTLHCGIDVFQLLKANGEWRISGLTWTAEPTACPELKPRK